MKKFIFLVSLIIFSNPLTAKAINPTQWTPVSMAEANTQIGEIWGNIGFYNNTVIKLENGQQFRLSKNVLIDVENLANDIRGNVRVLLDADGKAKAVFFHGIDMPEVIRRYKR